VCQGKDGDGIIERGRNNTVIRERKLKQEKGKKDAKKSKKRG
jgi:hypothetical protein